MLTRWTRGVLSLSICYFLLSLAVTSYGYFKTDQVTLERQATAWDREIQRPQIAENRVAQDLLKNYRRGVLRGIDWNNHGIFISKVVVSLTLVILIWAIWQVSDTPQSKIEIIARWTAFFLPIVVVVDIAFPDPSLARVATAIMASLVEVGVAASVHKICETTGQGELDARLRFVIVTIRRIIIGGIAVLLIGLALDVQDSILYQTCVAIILFADIAIGIECVLLFQLWHAMRTAKLQFSPLVSLLMNQYTTETGRSPFADENMD